MSLSVNSSDDSRSDTINKGDHRYRWCISFYGLSSISPKRNIDGYLEAEGGRNGNSLYKVTWEEVWWLYLSRIIIRMEADATWENTIGADRVDKGF